MWVCVFVCARGRGGRDGKEAKKNLHARKQEQ